jgi:hypothetical protein
MELNTLALSFLFPLLCLVVQDLRRVRNGQLGIHPELQNQVCESESESGPGGLGRWKRPCLQTAHMSI